MSTEWKPGAVAMVTAQPFTGMKRTERAWVGSDDCWHFADGAAVHVSRDDMVSDARPVVVIDPESGNDVSRLIGLLFKHGYKYNPDAKDVDLAAALREFANPTPPRIDEPGIGGVVEASCVHSDIRLRWLRQAHGEWYPLNATTGADDWASLIDPALVREGVES